MRFLAEKEDLSQQKMADILGIKRGRIAGLFYETQPKEDIQLLLVEKFDIDRGKFLTIEMNHDNYSSFFTTSQSGIVEEPRVGYRKSDVFSLLSELKEADSKEELSRIVDQIVSIYGKVLEENGLLREEITQLQRDLLDLVRKS